MVSNYADDYLVRLEETRTMEAKPDIERAFRSIPSH